MSCFQAFDSYYNDVFVLYWSEESKRSKDHYVIITSYGKRWQANISLLLFVRYLQAYINLKEK